MSNEQDSNTGMSNEASNEVPRRHGVYQQLAHQNGPTANRAQNCVICLDDMEANADCLIHADGKCLNAWHTECLELELQASEARTGCARCPNCRIVLGYSSPTAGRAPRSEAAANLIAGAGARWFILSTYTNERANTWELPLNWSQYIGLPIAELELARSAYFSTQAEYLQQAEAAGPGAHLVLRRHDEGSEPRYEFIFETRQYRLERNRIVNGINEAGEDTEGGTQLPALAGVWQTPRRWSAHFHAFEDPDYYRRQPESNPARGRNAQHNRGRYQRLFDMTAAELAISAGRPNPEQMTDEDYARLLQERQAARRIMLALTCRPRGPASILR